jgi:hypothetical protein
MMRRGGNETQIATGVVRSERREKRGFAPALVAFMLLLVQSVRFAAAADTPVTPNASPETQSLLAFLSDIYGKKILSGQQAGPRGTNELGFELSYLTNTTGKLPAMLALDLIASTGQAPHRDMQHATAQWAIDWYTKRKGVVALCWHWYAPLGEPAFYTKDTKFDLSRAVVDGTPENHAMLRDLDLIADELALLRDAHVPVLWRPMHEVNGRWFWWGAQGPEPYKKLWRLMFDRYTQQRGLTNLLWVFSPGAETDLADWYPGDAYVDLIGQDHYPMDGNRGPAKEVFDELVALGRGNKPVGMSENGPLPDMDRVVKEQANWLFFTTWSGRVLTQNNSKEQLIAAYHHPSVLTLADLPELNHYPFKAAGKAVRLGFPAPPGDVAVGGLRRLPVTVAVQDEAGRTVRDGSFTVTLALKANPADDVLLGTLTATTVNGVATFPDLLLKKAAGGYTLSATAKGLQSATSAAFQVGPGAGISRTWWTGTNAMRNADGVPAGQEILGRAFEVPVHSVTNYQARFRGELVPPESGSYTFWIASLAYSELWLSTDATPAEAVKIAEVNGRTPYSKWPHVNEGQSSPVALEAGRHYFIEVRQLQSAGSGQLSVRWRLPGGVDERPIPALRLFPRIDAANGKARE